MAGASQFTTMFYPSRQRMTEKLSFLFDHQAGKASANRRLLLNRPRAALEPAETEQGRWLTTDGVKLEETGGLWRFSIEATKEGLGRGFAELPLPDDFEFKEGALLELVYRLATPARRVPSILAMLFIPFTLVVLRPPRLA